MTTQSNKPFAASAPSDTRALIAVDLGAESCRVCLLRWKDGRPQLSWEPVRITKWQPQSRTY